MQGLTKSSPVGSVRVPSLRGLVYLTELERRVGEAHNILSSDGVVEAHQVPYVGKHLAHYAFFL